MGPLMKVDGGICPAEGYAKIDFGRLTVTEAKEIRKAWREGGSAGSRQQEVMEGDVADS